jgi:hypothetical protein
MAWKLLSWLLVGCVVIAGTAITGKMEAVKTTF